MNSEESKEIFKTIALTDEQYRRLCLLLGLGSRILTSVSLNQSLPLIDIGNYLFSYAKEFNASDLIEYDARFKVFHPAKKIRKTVSTVIKGYDQFTLCHVLSLVLAERDQQLGLVRPERLEKVVKEYYDELCLNGLKNFFIR